MKATEEFYHQFCHTSSVCTTCSCGRTTFNYAEPAGCWEPGELEQLQRKSKANPDKFIGVDYSVPAFSWGGEEYVIDCPCGKDVEVQKLVWNHRHDILRFLKAIIDKNLKRAQAEKEMVDSVKSPN